MIKAPVERYPPRDKSEHWVFAANIPIQCKGKIWTGTMSPWTVETYICAHKALTIQPGYQIYQPEPSCSKGG